MDNQVNQIATWLSKGHAEKLMKAAQSYWNHSKDWVMWAVNQKDEQQSEEPILGLLAWERLTERLPVESGELFRKRVQHALINTVEAGEISSIVDIFKRLDIQVLKVTERIEGRDWDIIAIDFSNHTMARYSELLPELVQLYGRACRRYEFTVHNVAEVGLSSGWLDVQWDSFHVTHHLVVTEGRQAGIDYGGAFIGAQYEVQKTPLLPLNLVALHQSTTQPFFGFLNKDGGISTAAME